MDERAFSLASGRIADIAKRRGGASRITLAPPGGPEAIGAWTSLFNDAPPPSLANLWRRHDGIAIYVYSPEDDPNGSFAAYTFEISSISETLRRTSQLRQNFADMRQLGEEEYRDDVARRYVDFASLDDAQRLTLMDLGRRDDRGEAPIIEVHQYDPYYTGTTEPVAASLDEFIERCLTFMIDNDGHGFRYWIGAEDFEW